MIVGTVFLSNLNQMDFHLVQNRKENCYHDHIPFNVKGNGNIVFSVYVFFLLLYLRATQKATAIKTDKHLEILKVNKIFQSN